MQLALLGVPQEAYEREMAECSEVLVAKTASKSLLGTLNDYTYMVHHRLSTRPDDDLEAAAFSLSHTPLSPLGYKYASEVARAGCVRPRRACSRSTPCVLQGNRHRLHYSHVGGV